MSGTPLILTPVTGAENLEINETDGTENLATATDVFDYIDKDFQNWGTNAPGPKTPKTNAQVLEMVNDGDFKVIFTIPGRDLNSLCWEQSQIKAFVRKHKKWLRTQGFATFFLFKVGEGDQEKFFVAHVYVLSDSHLGVDIYHFSNDNVWNAENRHRVVLPQLKLKS